MVFRNFRFVVFLRIAVLALTILGLVLLVVHTSFYATATVLAVAVIIQFMGLLRYVERTSDEVGRFLRSIRYADFSTTFTGRKRGKPFDELRASFNEVMEEFRKTRSETEEQAQYLQTVVQHVGVGLMSFTKDGEVGLINTAAKRMFQIHHLANIRSLEAISGHLVATLRRLTSGEKALVKIEHENETLQLAIYATELRLRDQHYTLVSLHNIRSELEENEMEAWQNLIRVLTHEIMNSITPISSLASTVNDLLDNQGSSPKDALPAEAIEDIRRALQTIEKRSQGLLHFVDAYRDLTRIPRPEFRVFHISELFSRVEQLLKQQLDGSAVALTSRVEPSTLELAADQSLLEQVLINLVVNAMHALEGRTNPAITLDARMNGKGRVAIEVQDNGPGIPQEIQDRIFIPFFTTKKDGSGIGLSLSRQIIRLHGGTISVRSIRNERTVFTMRF
jgi:nitrogen fixation/metabolism regulation signal transduction histidine kinase